MNMLTAQDHYRNEANTSEQLQKMASQWSNSLDLTKEPPDQKIPDIPYLKPSTVRSGLFPHLS
jgi:hypothetical protein